MTSGGRLAGIDVADNDDVDVSLVLLTHGDGIERCLVVVLESVRLPDKIALESRYSDEEAKEKEKQNCWRGVRNLLTVEGRESGGMGQKFLQWVTALGSREGLPRFAAKAILEKVLF